MGASLSTERRPQLLSGCALAAVAAAIWLVTSSSNNSGSMWACFTAAAFGKKRLLSKAKAAETMKDIAEEFFAVFTELAQVARSVTQAIQGQSFAQAPTREQVEAMLMEQVFRERLTEAEAKILKKNKVSKAELEHACTAYQSTSEEIALYVEGLKAMYRDALIGELPLLPGAVLPESLSEELVFSLLREINKKKQMKFAKLLNDTQPSDFRNPSPALTKKLQDSNREAEKEGIYSFKKTHGMTTFEKVEFSENLFFHAVAVFSRDPQFKIRKQLLDEMHTESIMEIMEKKRKEKSATSAASDTCVVAALHPKLEETTAEELKVRLESAAETSQFLVCLILKGEGPNEVDAEAPSSTKKGRGRHQGRGIASLKALDDFSEAIEAINDEAFSFVYFTHEEAGLLSLQPFKDAAKAAEKEGASYLLYKGDALHASTTVLKELIGSATAAKQLLSAHRKATASKACNSSNSTSYNNTSDNSHNNRSSTNGGCSDICEGQKEPALPLPLLAGACAEVKEAEARTGSIPMKEPTLSQTSAASASAAVKTDAH